jgi:putative aldouronate transport system permease protein
MSNGTGRDGLLHRSLGAAPSAAGYLRRLGRDMARDWRLYLLALPCLVYLVLFCYKPIGGLQIAFKNYSVYRGIDASPWVGLKHFIRFFTSYNFGLLIRNTFLLNLYGLLFGFPFTILFGILVNDILSRGYQRAVQLLTYLPNFISTVIVVSMITLMLSPSQGLVNNLIEALGGKRIYFLTRPEWFRFIYIASDMWQYTGFGSVIIVAALTGVAPELYEAAIIDGAGKLQRVFRITLPSISATLVILLVLSMGGMLSVGFEKVYLLYNPVTYETADVISTYVYRIGLTNAAFDYATAVGLFNAVISLVMVAGANLVARRFSETSLW